MLLISALALGLVETANQSAITHFSFNQSTAHKSSNKNIYPNADLYHSLLFLSSTSSLPSSVSSTLLSFNYYFKSNYEYAVDLINNIDHHDDINNVMAQSMTSYTSYSKHHKSEAYNSGISKHFLSYHCNNKKPSESYSFPTSSSSLFRSASSSSHSLVGQSSVILLLTSASVASLTTVTVATIAISALQAAAAAALLAAATTSAAAIVTTEVSNIETSSLSSSNDYQFLNISNKTNFFNLNNNSYNIESGAINTSSDSDSINTNKNHKNNSNGASVLWNQFNYNNKINNYFLNRTNNYNLIKHNRFLNKYKSIQNSNTNNNNNNMMLMMPSGIDSSSIIDSSGNGLNGGGGITNGIGLGGDTIDNTVNLDDWSINKCLIWSRPYEIYFQLSNAFFLIAFIAPNSPYGMLWMRSFLLIGCVLMATYGWFIQCRPDVILWSGLFLSVNFVYLIILICRLRPIRFDKEIEAVYESLFKPLRVSRHQFKKVLSCMKLIRSLKYQEVYAQEKVTKVDSLSLVLSGKLVVSQNQRALHIVFPHQFLDSPEWFGVSTDDYFQVSIMAMEESRVLIWHRDKLKLSIMTEPFLQAVFDHILGRDVVKKLMQVTQVSETMASNGFLPSGGYGDDSEDKPMLCIKKNEGHGLTALINRQLQDENAPLLGRTSNAQKKIRSIQQSELMTSGNHKKPYPYDTKTSLSLPRISKYYYVAGDPNAWRLGRIEETDHETAV